MRTRVLRLHERNVLLEHHPDLARILQLPANDLLHVDRDAILVAHALCKAGILPAEVLVAMDGHVA